MHETLVEALSRLRRSAQGVGFLGAGGETRLSYGELHDRALRLLGRLQERGVPPGSEMVLQVEDLQSFLTSFWACLLGGLVPVPLTVLRNVESRRKVLRVWSVLREPYLLAEERAFQALRSFAAAQGWNAELPSLDARALLLEELAAGGGEGAPRQAAAGDVAFVQFSSGSTGDPKGVVLTHENLLTNIAAIAGHLEITPRDSCISWMPLTHDFGLIGFHLVPLVVGCEQNLMPTRLFVEDPALWLDQASRHRSTMTGTPSSGLRRFLAGFRPERAAGWDLSSLRTVFNGAEPISPVLCEAFLDALAPWRLPRTAICPAYGLAEATLAVALLPPREELRTVTLDRRSLAPGRRVERLPGGRRDMVTLMQVGPPIPHVQVRIVDEARRPLPEGTVGAIEIQGGSVTRGYYAEPADTPRLADGWLDTGDLGFFLDGRLVVAGRSREILFVHGVNHFPHDVERVAEEVEGIAAGGVVVGAADAPERSEILAFVVHRGARERFLPLAERLRRHLLDQMGLPVDRCIPVKAIPTTTSGKARRLSLVQRYLDGEFEAVLKEIAELAERQAAATREALLGELAGASRTQRLRVLEEAVAKAARQLAGGRPLDLHLPLAEQGLDSLRLTELVRDLSRLSGLELPVALPFDHPRGADLAAYLERALRTGETAQEPADGPPPQLLDEVPATSIAVAIVGAGCRFPGGGTGPRLFWDLLDRGVDAVGEVPADRWDAAALHDPDPQAAGRAVTRQGAFLDGVDLFDAGFFGISPREARDLDPQQRLLLEVAWEALEDAGQDPSRLAGSATGVFIGISHSDYGRLVAAPGELATLGPYSLTGSAGSVAAGRIAYVLGLRGPALAVDTACSSSLAAVHLAVRSLRAGEADLALAGGVNLILSPEGHVGFSRLNALSRDGRCKAFDERADGYGRGEGCGVVVLKRLADAERDGDSVLAVILGSAMNHDGHSNGLTAPNGLAQQEVVRAALRDAGVAPREVGYVEAHGTGTPLGDAVELLALGAVFAPRSGEEPLVVGSVKTNLGHLESAAGIAGLLKAALALRHGRIPRHLHLRHPSERLPWSELPLRVVGEEVQWPRGDRRRIAGVSAFGLSGTNVHVVLAEAPEPVSGAAAPERPLHLLPLSARSPGALVQLARCYAEHLAASPDLRLGDVCFTAGTGRAHFPHRLCVLASTTAELASRLAAFAAGRDAPGVLQGRELTDEPDGADSAEGSESFLESLARRYLRGAEVDWRSLDPGVTRRRLHLPTYPFERLRYWREPMDEKRPAEVPPPSPAVAAPGRRDEILTVLRSLGAELLQTDPSELDAGRRLLELGADSLVLAEVVKVVESRFGVAVTLRQMFEELTTLASLADYIAEHLPTPAAAPVTVSPAEPAAAAGAAGSPGTLSGIEGILKQQLDTASRTLSDLVAQQLDFLRGQGAGRAETQAAVRPAPEGGVAAPPARAPRAVPTSPSFAAWRGGGSRPRDLTPEQRRHLAALLDRHTRRTAGSRDRARRYRPAWADIRWLMGLRPELAEVAYPIVARRAEGSRFEDVDGHEYVDLTMDFGVNLFGHGPPFLRQALEEQMRLGMQVGPQSDLAGEVAELVRELTGMERATFCNSGTEAVMAALRMARAATGRSRIAFFSSSYHGHSDATLAVADPGGGGPRSVPMVPGVPQAVVDESLVLDYGDPRSLEILAAQAHDLAAVLVEPVPSRRPQLQPRAFLQELRALTARAGVPLIFDEVITGFRVHPGGAQAVFGITADMAVYGKVVGGGMPIGIAAGRADLLDTIDGGAWDYAAGSSPRVDATFVAGTFCKHPLAMATARAVLRRLRQGGVELLEGLNQRTSGLTRTLNAGFAAQGVPATVASFGSLFRFSWSHNSSYLYQPLEMDLLFLHLLARGVYVWEGRTCFLSTAHGDDDLERVAAAVAAGVEELRAGGFLAEAPPVPTVRGAAPPTGLGQGLQEDLARLAAAEGLDGRGEARAALDALAVHHLAAAFGRMGWTLRPGERATEPALASRLGVVEERRRLFGRLLEILAEAGLLRGGGEEWEVARSVSPDAAGLQEETAVRHSGYEPLLTLLERCGAGLPGVLRGEVEPAQVLFPGGDLETLTAVYGDTPVSRTMNLLTRSAVGRLLADRTAAGELRILEVGAGTGATTSALLPELAARGAVYDFTDVSRLFLAVARRRLREHRFVRYLRLDLDEDPGTQGFAPAGYDLVLAAGVLHVARDLRRSLAHLRHLLAPGGWLVVRETTAPRAWTDLIFGLTDGWWRFADLSLRPSHPLLAADRWRDLLAETGFDDVVLVPPAGEEAPALADQALILARLAAAVPLTPAQKQLWALARTDREASLAYHVTVAFRLRGALRPAVLRQAWQAVARRHEALRTTFDETGDVQRISPAGEVELPLVDLSGLPPERREDAACSWFATDAGAAFDLAAGPLCRVALLRLEAHLHLMTLTVHHLVADGWSVDVLCGELAALYAAGCEGVPCPLDPPVQFRDFLRWQTAQSGEPEMAAHEAYWLSLFSDPVPALALPGTPGGRRRYHGARRTACLPPELADGVRRLGQERGCTPFMVLLAAFAALLHRLTGQDDLVIGIPVAGRSLPRDRRLVGYCTHLLPIRSRLAGSPAFADSLDRIRETLLSAWEHQDLPAGGGRSPRISAVFNLEHPAGLSGMPGLVAEPIPLPIRFTGMDLGWNVIESGDRLVVSCDHAEDRCDGETVERLLAAYQELLARVVSDPGSRPSEIAGIAGIGEITPPAAPAAGPFARPGALRVAPRGAIEGAVAEVWRGVLGLAEVGIDDGFFDVGGSSVHLARLYDGLRARLGGDFQLVDLFAHPTIREQARLLAGEPRPEPRQVAGEERGPAGPVAIVGMAGRFPGARNVEALWENLCRGVESVTFFTDEELAAAGVAPALLRRPDYVKARPVLAGVDRFDASFFGFSPGEAETMDPQHRLFLEAAWEVLEAAGYAPGTCRGRVGVYAGANLSTYLLRHLLTRRDLLPPGGDLLLSIGNDKDFLATRVSYKLGLTGPSLNVNTACSTSLVAVHQACEDLRRGHCDLALAGGVSIDVPQAGYLYEEGGIVSPDGHCRPFDAAAGGTVFGNGLGIVALKRLDDALADRDFVWAVIRGSAVNNDGAGKVGFTAPGVDGQAEVVAEAQRRAGVEPGSIDYIESHGTGTALGDPIEVAALTRAFRAGTDRTGFCALGSIKGNVGHLDTAAGVTGLIKAALCLRHGLLPPTLHFERPNPGCDLAGSPFYVHRELVPWPPAAAPRRAGVSSFGIGGTNAHVVLEEAPADPSLSTAATAARPWQLLVLSARSDAALDRASAEMAGFLSRHPEASLADVSYTLQVGRKAFDRRRIVVCREAGEAAAALAAPESPPVYSGRCPAGERPVVFLFPGQGAQHAGMGRGLYADEPVFRGQVDLCAEILRPRLGLDLRPLLFPRGAEVETAGERLRRTELAQPALFVVEYALARLWMEWGVRPWALMGHSLGEYVAACLAGVFSLEDALALVASRGELMGRLPPGSMAAVPLPEEELAPWLCDGLALAAVNGPALCVVSGPGPAVAELCERLRVERAVETRLLETSHAFHSSLVDPVLAPFAERVARTRRREPGIPFVSNLTGTWIAGEEAVDPEYWARHLRSTVRFAAGLELLFREAAPLLLEVGPGQTLTRFARRHPGRPAGLVALPSARPSAEAAADAEADTSFLLTSLGRLWIAGATVDWQGFHAGEERRRVPLPTYSFERQRYWVEPREEIGGAGRPDDAGRRPDLADWFYVPSWRRSPLPARNGLPEAAGWLLFLDDRGLGERLAGRLEALGHEVLTVRPGPAFRRDADGRGFAIDPGRPEDYEALFNDLAASGRRPDRIVHLWNVTAADEGVWQEPSVRADCGTAFHGLVALARALGRQGAAARGGTLTVVSNQLQEVHGGEPLRPGRALLLGPVGVIPREVPSLRCRSIDVACDDVDGGGAERLVERLLEELLADAAEEVVAWRGPYRWVQGFEPLRLEPGSGAGWLRPRGVYLITGGTGGIGLTLARHLAEAAQARLVLTGLSELPERSRWSEWLAAGDGQDSAGRRIREIQAMEAHGAEVLLVRADVADAGAMRAAIAEAERRFGPIQGVVHAAGIPGGGLLQGRTREAAARVLAPKVEGTRVLVELLAERRLDFFAFCSSVSAVCGELGQSDYCSANAFLDAAAHELRRRGTPAVSIGWGPWREVGMLTETDVPPELRRRRAEVLEQGIAPAEGVEAFRRALASGLAHVLVSPRDLDRQREESRRWTVDTLAASAGIGGTGGPVHERPELSSPYAAPASAVEEVLARVWQEVLGVSRVGVEDDFHELGGHSLLATRLIGRVNEIFQRDLTPDSLLGERTIAGLARALTRAEPEPGRMEAIASLYREIDGMAASEVRAALGAVDDALSAVDGAPANVMGG